MGKNTFLIDHLIEDLTDLLNAESQMAQALPRMAEASGSLTLKAALEYHLKITRVHVDRLQNIFTKIGQVPKGVTCIIVENIIKEGMGLIKSTQKGPARDIVIISMALRMKQYEIHGYQTGCEHASDLKYSKIVGLLYRALEEERAIYSHLKDLAQCMHYIQAIDLIDSHQQSEPMPERPTKTKIKGFYLPKKRFGKGGIKNKSRNPDVSRFIDEGNPNFKEP